ncbi:MAG: hypothetical protein PUI91_05105, partial [Firmicutes bacterium]|nr:hypothetical protein [Bacillota bacterium]
MRRAIRTVSAILAVVLLVTAFGTADVSAKSKKSGAAKLARPKISVKTSGRYDVTLHWKSVNGAEKYLVYQSTKKHKGYKLVMRASAGTNSYHTDSVKSGKLYFKVKCVGKVNGKAAKSKFSKIKKVKISRPNKKGNSGKYALGNAGYNGKLKGKKLVFVGSSLTAGYRSKNVSFVDYLAKRTGCTVVKDGRSGTTTARNGSGKDFVTRSVSLINRTKRPDLFLCQLSANDATKGIKLGKVTPAGTPMEKFDTTTVAGAMEYIICYSDKKWGCPVVFYTAMHIDNP